MGEEKPAALNSCSRHVSRLPAQDTEAENQLCQFAGAEGTPANLYERPPWRTADRFCVLVQHLSLLFGANAGKPFFVAMAPPQ